MSKAKQSFGEQAARFSLYVPLVVLAIGCLSRGSTDQSDVAITLFWINVVLIVAGFVLGTAALLSMKRYGPERIRGRAIVGVVLNGIAIATLIAVVLPIVQVGAAKAKMIGHWSMQTRADPASKQIDLTLRKDSTFNLTNVHRDGTSASIDGKWIFTRKKQIGITVERVNSGDSLMNGQTIGLGTVKTVDGQRLVLGTDKGEEVYSRIP